VSGIPEMIDTMVADIPNAEKGFRLLFASEPFPGYQVKLEKVREEYEGVWYRWADNGEGWICPALFLYFPEAPGWEKRGRESFLMLLSVARGAAT